MDNQINHQNIENSSMNERRPNRKLFWWVFLLESTFILFVVISAVIEELNTEYGRPFMPLVFGVLGLLFVLVLSWLITRRSGNISRGIRFVGEVIFNLVILNVAGFFIASALITLFIATMWAIFE